MQCLQNVQMRNILKFSLNFPELEFAKFSLFLSFCARGGDGIPGQLSTDPLLAS